MYPYKHTRADTILYAYQWDNFIASADLMWCQGSGGPVSSTQRALGASVATSTAESTMLFTDCPLVLSSTALWLAILETPTIAIAFNISLGHLIP